MTENTTPHIAVVTGASQGLGRALVHELAGRGVRVAALARDPAALNALVAEVTGVPVVPVTADVADPAQVARAEAVGSDLMERLPRLGPALVRESPARVVETALGRIEVSSAIPPPGGASPAGSHTHMLPNHLATGRALPVGMDLPRAYLPGAVFYPAPDQTAAAAADTA